MSLLDQIERAISDAGITGLDITLYADGEGAVVADGYALWTCRPERLLRAAESMVEDGTAERLRRIDGDDDGDDEASRYEVLCRRTGYLAWGDESDRALHDRVVEEWRSENPGYAGNWS